MTGGLLRARIPFSILFGNPFSILFGNTTKTAPVSALHQCQGDFRFHDSNLSFSPSPLLPPPFPFSFFIPFTKKAPVSALHRCQGDFRFHDSILSPSPSPLLSPPFPPFFSYSFRQHYENSPRGKAQHNIHSLSATQLTRKVQNSCVR